MINIVGLGATDENDLTYRAIKIINNGKKNFIRTEKTDAVNYFKDNNISYYSFDYVYEKVESKSFEDVYNEIIEKLLEEEKLNGEINYFVPGNPFVAEKTVRILIERTQTNVISGISFIEPILCSVKRDAVDGLMILDNDFNIYDINPDMDIIITQIYNRRIAAEVSLKLQEVYDPESLIIFINDAGLKSQKIIEGKLYELSRLKEINHRSALFIPKTKESLLKTYRKEISSYIEDKNYSYNESDVERIKEKIKYLADNIDESKDEIVFTLKFYLDILIELANRSGYYNFFDIYRWLIEKNRENRDFF